MNRYLLAILLTLAWAGGAWAEDKGRHLNAIHELGPRQTGHAQNLTATVYEDGFKISAWGGECEWGVQFGDQYKHHVVPVEGGVEWSFEVPEQPPSNVLSFEAYFYGVDVFYQPEEVERGYRPDTVKQSLAFYRSNCGGYNIMYPDSSQNEIYNAGKMCHVFRSKAFDANGRWTWCDMRAGTALGVYAIILPEDFWRTAAYPLLVDPTIGWYETGGSSDYYSGYHYFTGDASTYLYTATTGDQTTQWHYYGSINTTADVWVAAYTWSGSCFGSLLDTVRYSFASGAASLRDVTFAKSLTNGVKYAPGLMRTAASNNLYFYYDAAPTASFVLVNNPGVVNNPFTSSWDCGFNAAQKITMYIDVTSSGSNPPETVGAATVGAATVGGK